MLTPELMAAFRDLDTCSVSNAIETFDVRLRNEGFADSSVRCLTPRPHSMAGYAATARFRCSNPPMGHRYYDRTDWWKYVLTIPEPRVLVFQDLEERPGLGAVIGEVHASVLLALGCIGAVTNGAVRDLPAIEATGFHLFAGNTAVSHAYVHLVDFGKPVVVGGLHIRPGDLIQGDCHGVQTVPREIAAQVPARAREMQVGEQRVIDYCRSSHFALDGLKRMVEALG